MDTEQTIAELDELRGLLKSGADLAPYKGRIQRLYLDVVRRPLRECNCKNILRDAILEIYSILRKRNTTNIMASKARLLNGVVLQHNGSHYTNANLTDEVAREFLAKFPQRKNWFAVLPSATSSKEVVAEVAETSAEMPPKEAESESQPTTPKKKKTSAKRK